MDIYPFYFYKLNYRSLNLPIFFDTSISLLTLNLLHSRLLRRYHLRFVTWMFDNEG